MATDRQPAFLAVSRASLTFAAALSLARVFGDASWAAPIALGAAVPPLVLAFAHRRGWHPVAGAAVTAIAGAWLGVLVNAPSLTAFGFPTSSAIAHFGHDLARAAHVLRSAVVPIMPGSALFPAALLLAFVAVYAASAIAEFIGRHADAPVGVIGPSVTLYVVVAALGSGSWAPTLACYAVAVTAYLVALREVEATARRTWFRANRTRRSRALAGGLAGGALVTALAITAGPLFPGARGTALVNYRKLGSGRGGSLLETTSPLVTIGAKLNREANVEVFTARTNDPRPHYWRAMALEDLLDTGEWGLRGSHGAQRSAELLPGPSGAPDALRLRQSVRISRSIDPHWLPAVYRPIAIDLPDAAALPSSSTLLLNSPAIDGVEYEVESEVRVPPPDRLRTVTFDDLRDRAGHTTLPGGFSRAARELAEQLTRGVPSPYEKALELEAFFQGPGFVYDQSVDYGSSPRAIEQFVFEDRRGFCEQFAAAFAEMARSIGLPTRLAVGYRGRSPGPDGVIRIKGEDAHAWPEVWLGRDIGWYAFEPTKGRANGVTERGDPRADPDPTPGSTTTTVAGATTTVPPSRTTVPQLAPDAVQVLPPPGSAGARDGGRVAVGVGIAIGALAVAALAALAAVAAGAVARTRARRHAPDPRRRVLGAWAEALERLSAAGVTPRPSATPIEFALRHAPAHGAAAAGPALMNLARLHTAAMFARESPDDDDARRAWTYVDEIDAALRRTTTRAARWSARLRTTVRARFARRGNPRDE